MSKTEGKISCEVEHKKNILCELKKLQMNGNFCDAVVISGIDATRINVHRVVLSASSEFFSSLFATSSPEKKNNEFIIEEIKGNVLEFFVNFCYTGVIEWSNEKILDFLIAAKKFQFLEVYETLIDFLSLFIYPETFMEVSLLARGLICEKLEQNIIKFLKRNFSEILWNEHLLQMPFENFFQLISSNDLNDVLEEIIFLAVMTWINFDSENRKKFIRAFLLLLKLTRLPMEFIEKNVRLVCDSNEWKALYMGATIPRKLIQNDLNAEKTINLLAVGWNKNDSYHLRIQKSQILKYSFKTREWTLWKEILHVGGLYSCCLWNKKLYLIVGSTIICFDVEKGEAEAFENFKKQRSEAGIVVFQGCLYVLGGQPNCKSVERFDFETKMWSDVPDMKMSRKLFGTVVLDDVLYVIGGLNDKIYFLNETECFNPQNNSWIDLAPMNDERACCGVFTDGRFIYAVGGQTSIFNCLKTIERYDPQINKWIYMLNSLIGPRESFGCVYLNKNIFVVGGESNKEQTLKLINQFGMGFEEEIFDTMEMVDFDKNRSSYINSLPGKYKQAFLFLYP